MPGVCSGGYVGVLLDKTILVAEIHPEAMPHASHASPRARATRAGIPGVRFGYPSLYPK